MITGLDHVQVAAPPGCEADARRFYGELLGLPELRKPEPLRAAGGAWFALGAQQLHVGVAEPLRARAQGPPGARGRRRRAATRSPSACGAGGAPCAGTTGCRASAASTRDDPWGNRVELLAGRRPS